MHAETASTEDTAKFLAGLPVPANSPLARLQSLPAAEANKAFFDSTFERVDRTQIDKVKDWAKEHVTVHRDTLFYFFGGPDFLYANAFFPNAKTYVLAGLESAGKVPDLTTLPKDEIARGLHALEGSLRSILGLSFFQTKFMSGDFHRSKITGNIPVLYIFMARSGKEVHSAELIQLNEDGTVSTNMSTPRPGAARGVKITFSSPGGPMQTLYYFATNVAKESFKTSGLEAFCDKLGQGTSLVKSASYLLQGKDFSDIRNFILTHSAAILQDDTGVPIYRFDKSWDLTPYGTYTGPIPIFRYAFQPPLAALHKKNKSQPIDFSISYRYRPHQASLVWAVKQGASDEIKPSPAVVAPEKPQPEASNPDASKGEEKKPIEQKAEDKPKVEGKAPAESAPSADKSSDAKSSDVKPSDAKPSDRKADAAKPDGAAESTTVPKSTDAKSADPKPAAAPAPAH